MTMPGFVSRFRNELRCKPGGRGVLVASLATAGGASAPAQPALERHRASALAQSAFERREVVEIQG